MPFLASPGQDSHAKLCAVSCSPFLCSTLRDEQATATISSVSLFFKRFHLRQQFILLLVVLWFPITHLAPDYRERVSWSQARQTEKLSVRCLWAWVVLWLFSQPAITPVLEMVACPMWVVSQEGKRGPGSPLNSWCGRRAGVQVDVLK